MTDSLVGCFVASLFERFDLISCKGAQGDGLHAVRELTVDAGAACVNQYRKAWTFNASRRMESVPASCSASASISQRPYLYRRRSCA